MVLGPRPAELQALIARRQSLGLDGYDEVWKGEYHMAPMAHPFHGYLYDQVTVLLQPLVKQAGLVSTAAFNLGQPDDFRVPDGGIHRTLPEALYVPTAAAVIEIESPHNETWEKLGFYAERAVAEVLVVSRSDRSAAWLVLEGNSYSLADHSTLLGSASAHLAANINWPPAEP